MMGFNTQDGVPTKDAHIATLCSSDPPSPQVLSNDEWNARYPRRKKESSNINWSHLCKSKISSCKDTMSIKKAILQFIPILSWLPQYPWRKDAANDFVAGLSVAVMHIPQAMAYAILAGVEPIYGIYTSVFPVLMYMVLGTSWHCSMGTSDIAAILVAKVVQEHTLDKEYAPIEVAVACTFSMGIIHLGLGLFKLGNIKIILTDALISGFTVGAAIHVLTSQLKHVFGLQLEQSSKGPGKIIFTFIEIFSKIDKTNLITFSISATSFLALLAITTWVGPRLKKICKFPIPIQLFVIVIGTILSHFLDLRNSYNVQVISDIGNIPPGLPSPVMPRFQLVPLVFIESIPFTIIAFVINQGLGIMFADKHGYKISANQELVASGASNILGSMFSCIPMAASMSRSLVQEASGSRSLLTAFISSVSLLAVLLWLGPYLTPLPICLLSSIILAALKGMLLKITDIRLFYARSRWDAVVWLVTFLATVLLDIDMGLIVGIGFTVMLVLIRSCVPTVEVLQLDVKGEVWLNRNIYITGDSRQIIIQVKGPMQFLSAKFVQYLVLKEMDGFINTKDSTDNGAKTDGTNNKESTDQINCTKKSISDLQNNEMAATTIVLDLSKVSIMDTDGLKTIRQLKTRLEDTGVNFKISVDNANVFHDVENSDIISAKSNEVYLTYIDAVQHNRKI